MENSRVIPESEQKIEVEAAEKRLRELMDADMKSILACKFGQRFFIRLLYQLGYMSSPYSKNNQITAQNIGRLEMANQLASDALRLVGKEFYEIWLSYNEEFCIGDQ